MKRKQRSDQGRTCLTKAQSAWAYKKWCIGYSVREIADALYVSESTVYRSFCGKKRIRPPLEPPKE